MHPINAFEFYNLFVGTASGAGLLYLHHQAQRHSRYRRFVAPLVGGLVMFAIGGAIVDIVASRWAHLVHGIAALLVVYGLYDPVSNELRHDEWASLVLRDPSVIRDPREWMVPMDDEILELFHISDLVLTPAIIAYNTGYSREEVNRRLGTLVEHGFVERVERGKYRITSHGELYLRGDVPVAANGVSLATNAH